MTFVPLTVKIRIRIDCETIPDPYPGLETLETVVVPMQGTQACGDELVFVGAPEGTPEGTQDIQAGSHEMVVTEVKRKAVEPVASAGLPLKGKENLEKVESSMKNLEKEAQYLGQEVREAAHDIKDLGAKVDSTAIEVQRLRQELRDEAQDMKDRFKLGGRPKSSAGGQLVDLFSVYLLLIEHFFSLT